METAIAFTVIFTLAEAFSDAYIFRDFRNRQGNSFSALRNSASNTLSANKVWHAAQLIRQGAAIGFAAWHAQYWPLAVIAAAGFWIIHDIIVNTIGLGRGPFYVGNTAAIDRFFQRFDNPERAMGITKFVILTAAVALTLIFKP